MDGACVELDSEHKSPVCPPATLVIACHLGEGGWDQALMSTYTSSVLPPWRLPSHSSALPQTQDDPFRGLPFRPPIWIEFTIHQSLLCWKETTPPLNPSPRLLVAKVPHHDIAFEKEGWLQADAKLLGTRARNVTVEERRRQS